MRDRCVCCILTAHRGYERRVDDVTECPGVEPLDPKGGAKVEVNEDLSVTELVMFISKKSCIFAGIFEKHHLL